VLVVDASAALQASLASGGFAVLGRQELVAPPLLWSEVPSVLHELVWRGAITADLGRESLQRFLSAPIRNRRHARLTVEAWRVADDLGLAKTYDAEYLALARLLDVRLLTVDARLRRTGSRLVEIVGPTEL
jgi:predicted nucleic acid-binding protein